MQHIIYLLVFFINFLFINIQDNHAEAADIRVAFGVSLPPYVMSDSNTGIEYDIIKESLAHKGHSLHPVYMPFIEVKDAILEGRADAVATVKKTVGIEGEYSEIVIRYHNFAISRSDKNNIVETINDLSDKKIVAFQLATKYLGSDFAKIAQNNPFYRERTDQIKQVKLLLGGKVDFAISDKNIFLFYKKELSDKFRNIDVAYHDIFPPNDYKVVFKDNTYRDDFNEGIAFLRSSGRYEEIISSYLENTN